MKRRAMLTDIVLVGLLRSTSEQPRDKERKIHGCGESKVVLALSHSGKPCTLLPPTKRKKKMSNVFRYNTSHMSLVLNRVDSTC